MCVEDMRAAIDAAGGERTLLVGFSMGGLVSVRAAGHPTVVAVLGLAPWLPDQLDLTPLVGKRLDVIHGSLDRWLPGVPGVSPTLSRRGFERARSLGVEGTYTKIAGRRPRDGAAVALRPAGDAAARGALGRARARGGRAVPGLRLTALRRPRERGCAGAGSARSSGAGRSRRGPAARGRG